MGARLLKAAKTKQQLEEEEEEVTPEQIIHDLRVKLYYILEEPQSSQPAQVLSMLILGTIIFSIACFILETMPRLRQVPNIEEFWRNVEVICTIIFTVEYFVRMIVCDIGGGTVWQFVKNPSNLLDALAIMPFYLQAVMDIVSEGGGASSTDALRVLRAVRLIRLFRIFKLGKYSAGIQLMAAAVQNSFKALWVLGFFFVVGIVIFSSVLYYAERMSCPVFKNLTEEQLARYRVECRDSSTGWDKTLDKLCCDEHDSPLDFPSIVEGFWWAIVTMTTVGYGEISPKTPQGKIVGIVTMLAGILIVAMPVAVVGKEFMDVYNEFVEKTSRQNEEKANVMFEKRCNAIGSEKLEPPETPMTGLGSRLRELQVEDPTTLEAVEELSNLLDENEKMNETMHRLKVAEIHRQQEIHSRFSMVLRFFDHKAMGI